MNKSGKSIKVLVYHMLSKAVEGPVYHLLFPEAVMSVFIYCLNLSSLVFFKISKIQDAD